MRIRRDVVYPLWYVLAATVPLVGACDSNRAPTNSNGPADGEVVRLVVPAHDSTPKVEMSLQFRSVEGSGASEVGEPVGNAVYLAVRSCEGIHPGGDAPVATSVDFEIRENRVANPSSGGAARPERTDMEGIGESGMDCLLEQLRGSEIVVPNDGAAGEREWSVEVRAKLYPAPG